MRMYGRENIAVVHPTNAVSVTRNTLNGSTRNCLSRTSSGPSMTTRSVSADAAANVRKLAATFTHPAYARSPTSISVMAPASGRHSTAMTSIMLFELFEMRKVETVELLADLEEEYAEDQHADQHVERDTQLDDDQHCRRYVDQLLEFPLDVELADQPVQDPRQQQHLEHQSQRGRKIQVRLRGCVCDDCRGYRERQSLCRVQVDQRQHAALREHREGQQQQQRRQQVNELRVERSDGHANQLPSSRLTSIASTASRNAVPRNSGARKIRSLADSVSIRASAAPPQRSLATRIGAAPSSARQSLPSAMPKGKKSASPMHE